MKKDKNIVQEQEQYILRYDQDSDTATVSWKAHCNNLLDKAHRKSVDAIHQKLLELSPSKILVDLSECMYVITKESSKWYDHTLAGMFGRSEPRKLAIVVPENLFNHVVFEATNRAFEESTTDTQYFRELEKAGDWLDED